MSKLEAMGVQVRRVFKTSESSVNGMELAHQETTEFQLILPNDSNIRAHFSKEGVGKKLKKIFKKELQTGDEAFDGAIFVETDNPEATEALLKSPELRAAIKLAVETGGELDVDREYLTIEVAGKQEGDDPQVITIAAALIAQGTSE